MQLEGLQLQLAQTSGDAGVLQDLVLELRGVRQQLEDNQHW